MTSYFIAPNAPTLLPYFAIGQFLYGYAYLSTRGPKVALGLDHNTSPRQDLAKYGQQAVEKGKISQRTLDKLLRREAAHANTMENLPFFWLTATLVHSSGLSNSFVNKLCLVYSLVRLGYGYAYINNSTHKSSFIRSAFWWAGNFTCFYGLWQAGKSYNGGLW